jgi:hypothetical protein
MLLLMQGSRGSPPWPELAARPPMGWNGWLPTTRGLIPGYSNNETMYYAAADILVSSGLRDAGYDTILVTCAGWQRDPKTGKLMENPTVWPRGYKAFVRAPCRHHAPALPAKLCGGAVPGGITVGGGRVRLHADRLSTRSKVKNWGLWRHRSVQLLPHVRRRAVLEGARAAGTRGAGCPDVGRLGRGPHRDRESFPPCCPPP